MKRDIRFRGKSVETDKWIEGYYVQLAGFDYIVPFNSSFRDILDADYEAAFDEVDAKTLSQWTGLSDKNGVEIYEGDIVEFTRAQCRSAYRGSRMAVSYQTYVFCGFGFDKTMALTKKRANECNIIGNIYDNPELLK